MHFLIIIILSILLCCCEYGNCRTKQQTLKPNCAISIPSDIPKNEPLYLYQKHTKLQLFRPHGQHTNIDQNVLRFACIGKNNHVKIGADTFDPIVSASCNQTKYFQFGPDVKFSIKNVNCTNPTFADAMWNGAKCSSHQHGKIWTIGWQIDIDEFIPFYDICFDHNTTSVIWTKHSINGNSIKYAVHERTRRQFRTNGFPSKFNPSDYYKKASQLVHFSTIFGAQQKYFNTNAYLSRGHLTPDADFIFPNEQFATYFYMNVCPQFQAVNGGNWLRVESLARKYAEFANTQITILTGVFDHLQLPQTDDDDDDDDDDKDDDVITNSQPLYLTKDNQIEVPKWLWKIIKNDDINAAIVLITSNNPFARNNGDIKEFCTNVCERASIQTKHFTNIRKGYTFCCELNEFKAIIKTLPNNLNAKNLLQFRSISV